MRGKRGTCTAANPSTAGPDASSTGLPGLLRIQDDCRPRRLRLSCTRCSSEMMAEDARNGDSALAAVEFEKFRQRCPNNVLAFQYLRPLRDMQKLKGHVAALRKTIET